MQHRDTSYIGVFYTNLTILYFLWCHFLSHDVTSCVTGQVTGSKFHMDKLANAKLMDQDRMSFINKRNTSFSVREAPPLLDG